MITQHLERSAGGSVLAPLPTAAAIAHLQGAAAAVQKLLDGVNSSSPIREELWDIEQTLRGAYEALVACAR